MSSGKNNGVIDLRKKITTTPKREPVSAPSREPRESGKRVSPVRIRRRRTRLIITGVVLFLIILTAGGISYASYLPQYSIGAINVSGTQSVSPDQIQQYVKSIIYDGSRHILSRANIFLYPQSVIEKDIVAEFPRISSVEISRESLMATTLNVLVTERQPYAFWCDASSNCYDMDKTGFIFATNAATTSYTTSYIFSGGLATSSAAMNPQENPIGQTFAPGHMPGIVVFLQLLSQAGFTPTGATIQSDEDFTVPTSQGFSIYASFGEDAGTLVNNLKLILSSPALSGQQQNLEYVDLRFGDRVYYKFVGQARQGGATSTAQ